ncbi:MAG: thioesterase family protein [Spongiibacteraceae bacterium]
MKTENFDKSHFPFFKTVNTRWADNDIYGHVNNAVYYQYFDSVINAYLIAEGSLDIHDGDAMGFMVRSECDYFAPLAYPNDVIVGLAVEKLGNSSVQYRLGLFTEDDAAPAAIGAMVHVFVDRTSNRPVPIPAPIRAVLQRIQITVAN